MNKPGEICVFFTYGVGLGDWLSGGMLERELAIYRALSDRGFRIALWTYDDEIPEGARAALGPIEVIPVGTLGRGRIRPFLRSIFLPFLYREKLRRFDLFKTNQLWGAWAAWMAAVAVRRPWILREGYEYYEFALKMGKARWKCWGIYALSWLMYRASHMTVVTSEGIRDFAVKTFGLDGSKFLVLSNYVDTQRFRQKPAGEETQSRLLFVGRLSQQKNLEMLLAAAARAGVGLDICGEGPLREPLMERARALGADVRFLGSVPNEQLPDIYSSYMAYALVSHYEGVPKTLLEAMACESLVIGTDVDGIREFIRNGETGILTEKNEESLVRAIKSIKQNPSRFEPMRAAARSYVERQHSLVEIAKREAELYERMIHERAH